MNDLTRKKDVGYLIYFCLRYKVVYICSCRSFTWEVLVNLDGRKFDSMRYEEIALSELDKERKRVVREHRPIYNKTKAKDIVPRETKIKGVSAPLVVLSVLKESSVEEKLTYCRAHGISLVELGQMFKGKLAFPTINED